MFIVLYTSAPVHPAPYHRSYSMHSKERTHATSIRRGTEPAFWMYLQRSPATSKKLLELIGSPIHFIDEANVMSLQPKEKLLRVAVFLRSQGAEASAFHDKALSAAVRLIGNVVLSARRDGQDTTSLSLWPDCVDFICHGNNDSEAKPGAMEKIFLVVCSRLWDRRATSPVSPCLCLLDALGLLQAAAPYASQAKPLSPKPPYIPWVTWLVAAIEHFVDIVAAALIPPASPGAASAFAATTTSGSPNIAPGVAAPASTSATMVAATASRDAWPYLLNVLNRVCSFVSALEEEDAMSSAALLTPHFLRAWPALMAMWDSNASTADAASNASILAVVTLISQRGMPKSNIRWARLWACAFDVVSRAVSGVPASIGSASNIAVSGQRTSSGSSGIDEGPLRRPSIPLLVMTYEATQIGSSCASAFYHQRKSNRLIEMLNSSDRQESVASTATGLKMARNLWELALRSVWTS